MTSFLQGKNAVITGGSGTIGKAIGKALLEVGCNVYLTGRRQEALDAAVAELTTDENSAKVFALVGDCTDETSAIRDIFDKVEVDLLINNAGTLVGGKTEEISVDDFNRVMNVNVTGPFICAKEAIKQMKARNGGGRIINIGSLSAICSRQDSATYTTSKFGLLGLTHSLAIDCRDHGIAVGIIHPGNVYSNLWATKDPADAEKNEGFLQKEDVANAVLTMANLPYTSNIFEMTIHPTRQPFLGRG